MTNKEAINTLNYLKDYYNDKNEDSYVGFHDDDNEAIDMAIKALKQQPSEDAVSREAVIRLIKEYETTPSYTDFYALIEDVKALPKESLYINPKKVGKWIATGVDGEFECSCCQNLWQDAEENTYDDWIHIAKFCPCCGAEMGGVE